MLTVRIQEKNHSESIMVLKLKDGCLCMFYIFSPFRTAFHFKPLIIRISKTHCLSLYFLL